MKCNFCNREFHVCGTCVAWIDEKTGRKCELLQKMQQLEDGK